MAHGKKKAAVSSSGMSSSGTASQLASPATGAGGFTPHVASETLLPELTVRALVVGALLGIVFAASSVYLALKVGLTVSASIPVAVMSITILRALGRGSILENNIVQTTGSAGESIAAGVAFTLPALLLLGQDLELARVLLVALFGGLLGVLMMIPLRAGLIVKEHGNLTYPEGTACAEVLIVGEKGGSQAKTVFTGFGAGFVYGIFNLVLHAWKEVSTFTLEFWGKLRGATLSVEVSPAMLGVGYIIGRKTAANMFAGGALAYLILIPAIHLFGDGLTTSMYPATKLISAMSPNELRNAYVLYIGAGAVATGGIISLVQSLPTIIQAFRSGLGNFGAQQSGTTAQVRRVDQDLPMKLVVVGSLALVFCIWLAPMLQINFVSAILIVLFGFFFVTVSSRITGEIGSSSNPISGMTVATLLITCLLFLLMGWTGVSYRAMALSTAAIVCVAASCAGATSQDLKTGFLVGATPKAQQIAITVGVLTSAVVIGATLLGINSVYTTHKAVDFPASVATVVPNEQREHEGKRFALGEVHEPTEVGGVTVPVGRYLIETESQRLRYVIDPGIGGTDTSHPKLDAPKARLFSLIIDGILTQKLPWGLVLIGAFLAIMMELIGVAALPFAVGLYLPISTSTPIFMGGLIRWWSERQSQGKDEGDSSPGVLMASGLIAGGAIAGLVQAAILGLGHEKTFDMEHALGALATSDHAAMVAFCILGLLLWRAARPQAAKG